MSTVTNVIFAGIGGQGVLKASDILAETVFRAGFDVKKSEVHGMSQRGGSVSSDVRFGEAIWSPMVPFGEADYLVVLEPDQQARMQPWLRAGGVLIGAERVPAGALLSRRSLNVALLGVLSRYLSALPELLWAEALDACLPARAREANRAAFDLGRRIAAGSPAGPPGHVDRGTLAQGGVS